MKKLNLLFTSLLLFFATNTTISMEPHDQLKKDPYESLPSELQHIIRWSVLENAITFLSQQPINLPKECKFSHEITLDLDHDDVMITNNTRKTWNIMTGELKQMIEAPKDIPYIKHTYGSLDILKWDNDDHIYKPIFALDKSKPCAINKNIIAFADRPYSHTIHIINADTGKNIDTFQADQPIETLALSDDTLLASSTMPTMQVWNLKTRDSQILRPKMQVIKTKFHDDKALVIEQHADLRADHGTLQLWNIHTGTLLKTIPEFRYKYGDVHIAFNNRWAIALSSVDKKAWSLLPLQGTVHENPLVWITENANILQGNLIRRICQATSDDNTFMLALPEKLGVIKEDESQEQKDGRIYFTLPYAVRAYLRNCLRIKGRVTLPLAQTI